MHAIACRLEPTPKLPKEQRLLDKVRGEPDLSMDKVAPEDPASASLRSPYLTTGAMGTSSASGRKSRRLATSVFLFGQRRQFPLFSGGFRKPNEARLPLRPGVRDECALLKLDRPDPPVCAVQLDLPGGQSADELLPDTGAP